MKTKEAKEMRCSTCRYYLERTIRDCPSTECRRYPPTITDISDGTFPEVDADDWCGEWKINRGL